MSRFTVVASAPLDPDDEVRVVLVAAEGEIGFRVWAGQVPTALMLLREGEPKPHDLLNKVSVSFTHVADARRFFAGWPHAPLLEEALQRPPWHAWTSYSTPRGPGLDT